jgi:histidinol-phosphate phosphatase family protein
MKKNAAVFLDRDGTIVEEVGYLDSLEKLVIFPHTAEAIRTINESGMRAVVITNQSGVARGYFQEDFIRTVHRHITKILREKGVFIDGFYYCPHHPTEGKGKYLASCKCRKPEPGMLIRASEDMDIDLSRSYVVGDMIKDLELAGRVGAKGILVRTGYGSETEKEIIGQGVKPAYTAENILAAVKWIIEDRQRRAMLRRGRQQK